MGEDILPATWSHPDWLEPVTKGLKNVVRVDNCERSKSQMLRVTKFKTLLCVHCLCGLQVCQFIAVCALPLWSTGVSVYFGKGNRLRNVPK